MSHIKNLFFSESSNPHDYTTIESAFSSVSEYDDILYSSNKVSYDSANHIFNVNGKITANQIRNNSDVRLKTNIKQIENSLDIVKQLNGKVYRLKASNDIQYGFIAQEMERVIPQIVNVENGLLNISYIELIPFLVESIKHLDSKIETISEKLDILMRKFD